MKFEFERASKIITKTRRKGIAGMETVIITDGYKFRIVKCSGVYRVFVHSFNKEMTSLLEMDSYDIKGMCVYTAPKYKALKDIVEMIDDGIIQ